MANDATAGACDLLYRVTLASFELPKAMIVPSAGEGEMLRAPLSSLVVHSPDGWYLCDLGLHPDFRDRSISEPFLPWGPPTLLGDGDPIDAALAACGLQRSDLAGVIMSHLHVDHSGGLHGFVEGPPIYVQRAELDLALSDEGSPEIFYRREDYELDGLRWQPLDGDAQIAPGIDAISTPGHTAGHMSLRIRMAESGTTIYAFDAIPTAENRDRDEVTPLGVPPSVAHLREGSHRHLVDLARAEDADLIPGHCPQTWGPVGSAPQAFR
jgi:glyoxylase-like metal-dependent hydrolase (beta-lactamase superfamily II)